MFGYILYMGTSKKISILSLSIFVSNLTYATTNSQSEIEQLRAEVKELRALIMQQQLNKHAIEKKVNETAVITPVPIETAKVDVPKTPLLTTNGAEFKIYGFARLDGIYDIETASGEFIDMSAQPLTGAKDKAQLVAATTRLGIDVKKETDIGTVTAKVEGDFWGRNGTNRGNFRFRQGYVSVNNWLIGQTASSFISLDTMPDMIDFNAIVGGSFRRSPQLRYTTAVSDQTKLMVALEESSANSSIPDLTAKLEYKTDKGLANIRGVVSQVRDTTSKEKELGYGAAVAGVYKFSPSFSTSGQLIYLNGANKYSDTGSSTYILDKEQDIALNEMLGAYVAATYKFNPQWRSTLAYGWSEFDDDNTFSRNVKSDTANKQLQQAAINIIYNPMPNITLGGEYSWGMRELMSGDDAKLSRFNLMGRYNF